MPKLAQASSTHVCNFALPIHNLKSQPTTNQSTTIMRKTFYAFAVVAMTALSFTILSCKNTAKESPAPNTQQADTTAADTLVNDSAAIVEEATPEAETVTPGDRPTFQLLGNVKTCKLKNEDNKGKTTTYVFDEQGRLKTIDGHKNEIQRNKKGQIEGYSIGEYGLEGYTFAYDADGRLKKSSWNDADAGSDEYTYKYNAKGFVTSRYCKGEIRDGMDDENPQIYEENVVYDYEAVDAQGNWTKRVCHGATGRDPWTETRMIVYY